LRGCRRHAGGQNDCRERRLSQILPHVCPSIVRGAAPADPRVATRSVRGVSSTSYTKRVEPLARCGPAGPQWLSYRDDNMRSERPGKPKLTPRCAANCILPRQLRAAPQDWFFAPSSCAARRSSLCLEPGNDLARNGLDLLRLVFVRNEDDLLRSDRQVRLE